MMQWKLFSPSENWTRGSMNLFKLCPQNKADGHFWKITAVEQCTHLYCCILAFGVKAKTNLQIPTSQSYCFNLLAHCKNTAADYTRKINHPIQKDENCNFPPRNWTLCCPETHRTPQRSVHAAYQALPAESTLMEF